jgi:cell division protease FtsH
MVDEGQVSNVVISDSRIVGEQKNPPANTKKEFFTVPVRDDTLVQRLQNKGVTFSALPSSVLSSIFSWLLPVLIFYGIWIWLIRKTTGSARGGLLGITKSKAKIFVETDVKTTFADVAGVDEAKEELREIVSFLKDPEKYGKVGGRAPKGILLVGPPGTGKTLLARALAGEAKVPFFSINGSEFVEMFVGLGAARVRELFQDARSQAPCIIFIDEVDALGQSRVFAGAATGANDEKEQTLHQLLAEMDGFDASQGVIILAATNRPQILDPALLRAGRFDRQILVGFPDQDGRLQILKVHSKKIQLDPSVSLEKVATLTAGFSGAELANLVNEAALTAVRHGAEKVTQSDFTQAIERVVAGLEQRKRLMNPEEKRRVAYHEMGHATVLLSSTLSDRIHKVSIIPRGMGALGYTLQRPIEDRYLMDYTELVQKIAVLLGGRASEKVFFKTVSTGASDDLVKATEMARAMVTQYGMTDTLGCATFEQKGVPFLPNDYQHSHLSEMSEQTAQEIDHEIKNILDKAFANALKAVESHKNFIEEAVRRLLSKETLDEQEIADLWRELGGRREMSQASIGI